MKQFDKGWWNCFCSYTEEISNICYDWEAIAKAQLDAAGVTKNEISFVLKEFLPNDKTENLLKDYIQKI